MKTVKAEKILGCKIWHDDGKDATVMLSTLETKGISVLEFKNVQQMEEFIDRLKYHLHSIKIFREEQNENA